MFGHRGGGGLDGWRRPPLSDAERANAELDAAAKAREARRVKEEETRFPGWLKEYIRDSSELVFSKVELPSEVVDMGLPNGYAELGHGDVLYYIDEGGNLVRAGLDRKEIEKMVPKPWREEDEKIISVGPTLAPEVKSADEYFNDALRKIFPEFRKDTTARHVGKFAVKTDRFQAGPLESVATGKQKQGR